MINEAIEQLDRARKRLDGVKKENEALKAELDRLRDQHDRRVDAYAKLFNESSAFREQAYRAEQAVEELTQQNQSLMTERDSAREILRQCMSAPQADEEGRAKLPKDCPMSPQEWSSLEVLRRELLRLHGAYHIMHSRAHHAEKALTTIKEAFNRVIFPLGGIMPSTAPSEQFSQMAEKCREAVCELLAKCRTEALAVGDALSSPPQVNPELLKAFQANSDLLTEHSAVEAKSQKELDEARAQTEAIQRDLVKTRAERDQLKQEAASRKQCGASLFDDLEAERQRRTKLRLALITIGRTVGAMVSDYVSDEFLCMIPGEVLNKFKAVGPITRNVTEDWVQANITTLPIEKLALIAQAANVLIRDYETGQRWQEMRTRSDRIKDLEARLDRIAKEAGGAK